MNRLAAVLPLLVACIALAIGSHEPVAPLAFAFLALVSALVAARIPLDIATQRLAMVVVIVLTIIGIRASGMPVRGPFLGALGYGFALAPIVVVTLRAWIARVEWSARFDTALLLVSFLATGAARPGLAYLGFFVAFLAATLLLRRGRLPFAEVSRRTRMIAAAIVVTAAIAGALATAGAKVAYESAQQRLQNAFSRGAYEEIGLSDHVELGAMADLLSSDTVVLRISGPPIDRVRGVVLDEYGAGQWTRAKIETLEMTEVPRVRPTGDDVVEVRHIDPDRGHIFLPLEARDVSTPEGSVDRNSMGAVIALGDPNPIVWFRKGSRDALLVAPPRTADYLLPYPLRPQLTPIALEWTRDANTVEDALAAIQARLQRDYAYSLVHNPTTSVDPVLDFIVSSKSGHCEYFASAFALLARSLGIPTRMVLGYRVAERNPFWSSYVVRKKNAHAWVEAFVPKKGWVTVDPTPMTELPQDLPHDEATASAIAEAFAVAWDKTQAWLAKRSVFELSAAAIFGLVVFAFQRWVRARKSRANIASELGFAPPPRAFVELEAALARRGLGRVPSESIEHWAERLTITMGAAPPNPRGSLSPLRFALRSSDLAAVLARYANARYGDAREEGLEQALSRVTRNVTTS